MQRPDWQRAKQFVLDRLATGLPRNLTYHGIHHTRDSVLPAVDRLAAMSGVSGESLLLLRTAALYHDTGYVVRYFQNEPIAVQFAEETLPVFGYSTEQIAVISDIIMATQLPQSPKTFLAQLMCDADLDSLGREDYIKTNHNLRFELAAYGLFVPLSAWYIDQVKFLTSHSYFTLAARSLRSAGKRKNIAKLQKLHTSFNQLQRPVLQATT